MMITYSLLLYDVIAESYISNEPILASIAYYMGYIPQGQQNDALFDKGGQLVTDIPISRFDYLHSSGDNIGIIIEGYAKKIFENAGYWPVLRLCTTGATDDMYIEWNHNNPNDLVIATEHTIYIWASCFHWTDDIDITYPRDDFRRYEVTNAYVFVSAESIDNLDTANIIYSGSRYFNSTPYNNVLAAYTTANISLDLTATNAYSYNAETYLGTAGTDSSNPLSYYKSYNGFALTAFRVTTDYDVPPSPNAYKAPITLVPRYKRGDGTKGDLIPGWDGRFTPRNDNVEPNNSEWILIDEIYWGRRARAHNQPGYETPYIVYEFPDNLTGWTDIYSRMIQAAGVEITTNNKQLYLYLLGHIEPLPPVIPPSDVDPEDIPPEDEPPTPIDPDNPDPYYDPTSDPDSPDYEPTKDPDSPVYDPTDPHTPYRPPSESSPIQTLPTLPPQSPVDPPETPPSYVTSNSFFTLYNPSGGDLTNIANFLWSPAWSIDTFKKIFANPLDCILGLFVMPQLGVPVSTKEMNIGNIPSGITLHYFTKQFYDFDCGSFTIDEFYNSYLDYAPYTKINLFLPYIGDIQLNTDEVMSKTIGVKYRFDIASGDCVAFVTVDGSVMYSYSGNCAAQLPIGQKQFSGIIPSMISAVGAIGSMSGFPAIATASALTVSASKQDISHSGGISGSAGLMGVQIPYIIITRPRQVFPMNQNSYTGYPSFITENLGSLNGYTEIENCNLSHIPATENEMNEIIRLLKEGVLF